MDVPDRTHCFVKETLHFLYTRGQILDLISAAAAAPDHCKLRPWRFVEFTTNSRTALADVFEAALRQRMPSADAQFLARAREKSSRAPVLLGLVLRLNRTAGCAASG